MNAHRTKAQHYVPRAAYLEHFADRSEGGSILWVYPITKSGIQFDAVKRIAPIQLCKETYLYEAPLLPVNEIEKFLAQVESDYRQLLSEKISKRVLLSEEEQRSVALFISTLEARVPAARDNILKSHDEIKEIVIGLEAYHNQGKKTNAHRELDEARPQLFAMQIAISANLNRWQHSDFLFLHLPKYLENPRYEAFFLTSDIPVTMYDFSFMNGFGGIPPLSKSVEVVIPLTSRLLLLVNNRGLSGYEEIDLNFIYEANNRAVGHCYEHGRIISPRRLDAKLMGRILNRYRQSFLLRFCKPDTETASDQRGITGANSRGERQGTPPTDDAQNSTSHSTGNS